MRHRRRGGRGKQRIDLMFFAPRGLMSPAPENARWTAQRGLWGTNSDIEDTMTATETASTTDSWAAQLEQLRARYKHVRPPILAALNVLLHHENITTDDAKAQAALHGVRITAASVAAARTLLARIDGRRPRWPRRRLR